MGAAGSAPRVVLVEDDAALRRFAQLALEELDITLVECTGVEQALQTLQAAPARLVVTDLGLGDGSGLTLIERLARDPALAGGPRVVVFSAGITPEIRAQLQALGVWRILPKPVPLLELERCVQEAIDFEPSTKAPVAGRVNAEDVQAAVALHFGGDVRLYEDFRDACLAQFPQDAAAGDRACAAGDTQALRRVAHNLKTVLRSLGHRSLGDCAAAVEDLAAAGDLSGAVHAWGGVSQSLLQLTSHRAG